MSIAVVIPAMGRRHLGETVHSVVTQLAPEDRLLIEMDWPLTLDFGNRARDRGAAMAQTTHIWFLDDDDIALPGALAAMREAIEEDPRTAWVFQVEAGGLVLPEMGLYKEQIQYTVGCQCYLVPNPPPRWAGRTDGEWASIIQEAHGLKWRKTPIARLGIGK